MAFSAGTLEIDIRANLARLKQDMDETKKTVQGAMKDVEGAVNLAKTAFVALGGVLTLNEFKNFIQSGIEAKARLFDLSLQTGITVEALSGLGKIGKLSNTSLDEIASASNKLSKALFTQTEDSKGAAQAIKALGINFEEFKQLQAQDQMQAVAKALDGFRDGTEKSAAAMMLFGKTGAQLLPFLKELAEADSLVGKQTTESARQAKEYEDNLVKLKAAGDSWKREVLEPVLPVLVRITGALLDMRKEADSFNVTGAVIKTVFETVTVVGANVAFVFQGIGREMGAWAAQIAALGRGDFKQFSAISDAVKADGVKARAELDAFENRVLGLGPKVSEAMKDTRAQPALDSRARLALDPKPEKDKAAKDLADGYDAIMAKIREKAELDRMEIDLGRKLTEEEKFRAMVIEEVTKKEDKLSAARISAIDEAAKSAIALMKERQALEANAKWLKETGDENDRFIASQQQLTATMQASARDMELQLRIYGLTADELHALEQARLADAEAALRQKAVQADNAYLGNVAQLYRDQAQAIRDTAAARDALAAKQAFDRNDPTAGADRALKEYLADVKRAGDATYGAVANAMKGLEDLTVTALTGGDTKNAARAWVNGILQEVVRLKVVKPLLADVFGAGSGGTGNSGWAGLIGTAVSYFSGSYNANYGNEGLNYPAPRAMGGPVNAGGTYLVGEKGPGILRMGNQAGNVVPNDRVGGGSQTVNVVQNITVGAGVSPSQLAQALDQARERTKSEVQDQMRRGSRAYSG